MNISSRIIPARAGQTTLKLCRVPWDADHPRACGANSDPFHVFAVASGSSPRVRGKRWVASSAAGAFRIIPARAGQTSSSSPRPGNSTDHPRACGANLVPFSLRLWWFGSSPRVRGKPGALLDRGDNSRIIPARAGQTCCPRAGQRDCPDHPRACGANLYARAAAPSSSGSSPRVRGKLRPSKRRWRRGRIIPARAGQTGALAFFVNVRTDHPRACGANALSSAV